MTKLKKGYVALATVIALMSAYAAEVGVEGAKVSFTSTDGWNTSTLTDSQGAYELDVENAKTLSPKITLISVGAKNRYGHPNSKTIQMLESAGSQIYRTDQNGTITCKFIGSQIQIKTDK